MGSRGQIDVNLFATTTPDARPFRISYCSCRSDEARHAALYISRLNFLEIGLELLRPEMGLRAYRRRTFQRVGRSARGRELRRRKRIRRLSRDRRVCVARPVTETPLISVSSLSFNLSTTPISLAGSVPRSRRARCTTNDARLRENARRANEISEMKMIILTHEGSLIRICAASRDRRAIWSGKFRSFESGSPRTFYLLYARARARCGFNFIAY